MTSTAPNKPVAHQADLAKLPKALAPLIARPQWAVWRWTQRPDGSFQKPPFMAKQPQWHASTKDPDTWAEYGTALATVQAGHADGISYVLTESDPFAAIDLDHCRSIDTHSIDVWAQNFLETGRASYSEVTPSGTGCRIWGLANGNSLHRKFTLEIDGKPIAAELFRHTAKALTITGYKLDTIRELANIDRVLDWGVVWGERRKAAAAEATAAAGNSFNGGGDGSGYSVEQIEDIVRTGAPAGANRSNLFHTIVGHYVGCGWDAERILAHLQQFPDGIGSRYLGEGRLRAEVARSASKYNAAAGTLPPSNTDGWVGGQDIKTKAPSPEPDTKTKAPPPEPDPGLDNDDDELDDPVDDDELDDPVDDPELDKDPEPSQQDPDLPPLHAHGDLDKRPLKSWLIKKLMVECGHGLLAGQWGAGKTFMLFELVAALANGIGQSFLGYTVKRQCGTLLIAAEGANEVRLRVDAVVREKCVGIQRAPFRWYETAPVLLHKDSVEKLVALAKQADASLQKEFGLPLGLIIIDTIVACAGYARTGDESDPATGQAVMNVLKAVAQQLNCFVLGVDHFGKNPEAGTRGASSKEGSSDLVLVCLGDKELSGNVINTRVAIRKNRGGRQGEEFPFVLREVTAPEPDDDGDTVTTMVVDWKPAAAGSAPRPPLDPWAQGRRQDQRTAALRLKRVLMDILATQGVELPVPPDGLLVRMVDQEIVRKEFYAHTPADGTPEQKRKARHMQFSRARAWAEDNQLIGVEEIDDVTYLRLTRPDPRDDEGEPEPE